MASGNVDWKTTTVSSFSLSKHECVPNVRLSTDNEILLGLGIAIRKTGSDNPASLDVYRIRHQFAGSGKLKKMHEADFLKKYSLCCKSRNLNAWCTSRSTLTQPLHI
ncbi:hypothetical protein AVEN_161751-1 [Araneus ventricosus]|uniref:Uncharacterized protein n=1 Tax=Araneus ventricosus TaxID=182803 RepID=A0A4Y2W4S3_ARAVE|nr:hypothetical protein AVEN_161751-1 [Araneus ventricosus]